MFRTAVHPPRPPADAHTADIIRGLAAGIIGGIAGAWMMDQYHKLAAGFQSQEDGSADQQGSGRSGPQGGRQKSGQDIGSEHQQQSDSGPATEKAAAAVITGGLGYRMSKEQKQLAGTGMHYGFGASVGGLYGALAEAAPSATIGMGLPYGAGVWLAADEIAVPALGLARPPQEHPLSTHISALASHLIFGLTLEIVRRLVRKLL
jgi:putative membrane protein